MAVLDAVLKFTSFIVSPSYDLEIIIFFKSSLNQVDLV
jgi:hypothetical protein